MTTAASSTTSGMASPAMIGYQQNVLQHIIGNTSGTINQAFADMIGNVMPHAAAFRSAYKTEQQRIASQNASVTSQDDQETVESPESDSTPVSLHWLQTSGYLDSLLGAIQKNMETAAATTDQASADGATDAYYASRATSLAMVAQASGANPNQVQPAQTINTNLPPFAIMALLSGDDSGDPTDFSSEDPSSVDPYAADDTGTSPAATYTTQAAQQSILAGAMNGLSGQALMMALQTVLQGALASALGFGQNAAVDGMRSAMSLTIINNGALVDGWIWSCLFDDSCVSCMMMDGTLHDNSESIDSHKNCQCQQIPYSGPASALDGLQTGEDWLTNQATDAELLQLLGPSKFTAYQDGDVQLMDLVSHEGGYYHEASLKSLGLDFRDYLQQLPTRSELRAPIDIPGPHPAIGSAVLSDEERALLEEAQQVAYAAEMPGLPEIKPPEPGNTMGYRITDENNGGRDAIRGMFGKDLTNDQIGGLVGAQKDTILTLEGYEGEVRIIYHSPEWDGVADSSNYFGERVLRQETDGKLVMYNNSSEVSEALRGHGLGSKIFSEQVQNLSDLGVDHIEVDAAGDAETAASGGYNGYYTWARLGYNVDFPDSWVADFRDYGVRVPKSLQDATSLQDLMLHDGGPQWWKANGSQFTGTFDLTEGSTSRQILDGYLEAKGIEIPSLQGAEEATQEAVQEVSPEVRALQAERQQLAQLDPKDIHPTARQRFGISQRATYKVNIDGQSFFVKIEQDEEGALQAQAADAAAQAMDMGQSVVPARVIENARGTFVVQPWISGKELSTLDETALKEVFANMSADDLQRESLFEYLIGDTDRSTQGYFIAPDGTIRGVDFGGAFDPSKYIMGNNILGEAVTDKEFPTIAINRAVAEDLLSRADAVREAISGLGLTDSQLAGFDDRVALLQNLLQDQEKPAFYDLIDPGFQQYIDVPDRNNLLTIGKTAEEVAPTESPEVTALRTQKATLQAQRDAAQAKLDTLSEKWRAAVLDAAKYDPEEDPEEWAAAEKKIAGIEKQQATQMKAIDKIDTKMAKLDAKIEQLMPAPPEEVISPFGSVEDIKASQEAVEQLYDIPIGDPTAMEKMSPEIAARGVAQMEQMMTKLGQELRGNGAFMRLARYYGYDKDQVDGWMVIWDNAVHAVERDASYVTDETRALAAMTRDEAQVWAKDKAMEDTIYDMLSDYHSAPPNASVDDITKWNGSTWQVAILEAARQEFGLGNLAHDYYDAEQIAAATAQWGSYRNGIRALLRQMYTDTQQYFEDNGISEITLFRGVRWNEGDQPLGVAWGDGMTQNTLSAQPFSSWASDAGVAFDYATGTGMSFFGEEPADYSMLLATKVPANQVLSIGLTGFGATPLRETMLLAGDYPVFAVPFQSSDGITLDAVLQQMAGSSPVANAAESAAAAVSLPSAALTYTLPEIDQQAEDAVIQTVQDALSGDGVASHVDAIAIGQQIDDYIDQRAGPLADWYAEASDLRQMASVQDYSKLTGDQIAWISGDTSAHGGMTIQEVEAQYAAVRQSETLRLLEQVRDVGGVDLSIADGGNAAVVDALQQAQERLPADWLAASNDQGDIIASKSDSSLQGSGYYSTLAHGNGTIGLKLSAGMSDDAKQALALHELGHRMEDTVPGLWQMERDFYEARTAGEDYVRLTNGISAMTKLDNWSNQYLGRKPFMINVIRNGVMEQRGSYELLSNGLQYVLSPDPIGYYYLQQDQEFWHFILGILFGAKGSA